MHASPSRFIKVLAGIVSISSVVVLAGLLLPREAAAFSRQAQQYCASSFDGCMKRCRVGDTDCGLACLDKADACMKTYDKSRPATLNPGSPTPPKPRAGAPSGHPPGRMKQ